MTFLGRSIGLRATVQPGVHGYRHHATAAPTRKPSAIRDWVTSDLNRGVSLGRPPFLTSAPPVLSRGRAFRRPGAPPSAFSRADAPGGPALRLGLARGERLGDRLLLRVALREVGAGRAAA